MTTSEAREILELNEGFSKEKLRMVYHHKFIGTFRRKSASLTVKEGNDFDQQLELINQAYSQLTGLSMIDHKSLILEFQNQNLKALESDHKLDSIDSFSEVIQGLLRQEKYGLAISLLELGISMSLDPKFGFTFKPLPAAIRLLGEILVNIGFVNQGIQYCTHGLNNFEIGEVHRKIGEYKKAAHYFALELKNRETQVPIDEVCQKISLCYFLLNEYQNAINIIEEVLPQVLPKKEIFEETCKSKVFATAIMVSMYRLNEVQGKIFEQVKIWLKYPLCFKYLQNCYGKLSAAFEVIEKFEEDSSAYDDFLKSLKPKAFIKEYVELKYEDIEFEENYYDLFKQPMSKSLIYHPK